jgi:hypothetical protein
MFILGDGRTVVSQHYRLDETEFSGIPKRRPPGVAAFARVLPADDPYDVGFVTSSAFVVFGAAPCTAASGTLVNGEAFCAAACYSTSAFMCMHVQRRRPSPADVAAESAARGREISNLISIGKLATYSSPVLPQGARKVPGMHVLKLWPDGTLKLNAADEAKDRLCMRGDKCPRIPGVPTYSPCVEWQVFLTFCAVAVAYGTAMVQCDVVNAFVQALLSTHPGIPPTFMPIPRHTRHIYQAHLPGFRPEHKYDRVLRALYGLPESSCLFHSHLHKILLGRGFRILGGEPCVYVRSYPDGAFILIVLHVDDFMMANCGCDDVSFELAWDGNRTGLHGYLKTAGPREFLGTDLALTRVGAEDAVDLVDFTGGTGSMHFSCAKHIKACARLLPSAPPITADPRVPMSVTHYTLMARREGRPLSAEVCVAVSSGRRLRRALPCSLPQHAHGRAPIRSGAPPPLLAGHSHARHLVRGPRERRRGRSTDDTYAINNVYVRVSELNEYAMVVSCHLLGFWPSGGLDPLPITFDASSGDRHRG